MSTASAKPEQMTVDKKYVKDLKGKEHVLYVGLVDLAHRMGLQSVDTEILQFPAEANKMTCIVRAVVVMKDGTRYTGIGDAAPASVSVQLAPHLIRFAETRAKGRAMRDATNVGMACVEEMELEQIINEQLGRADVNAGPGSQTASRNGRNNPRDASHQAKPVGGTPAAAKPAAPLVQADPKLAGPERIWTVAQLTLPEVGDKSLSDAILAMVKAWSGGEVTKLEGMADENANAVCLLITQDRGAHLATFLPRHAAPAAAGPAADGVKLSTCRDCGGDVVWLTDNLPDGTAKKAKVKPAGVTATDTAYDKDRHALHWKDCKK